MKNKKTKKTNKFIIGIVALFIIILSIIYYIKVSNSVNNTATDNLAKCLANNGAKMYGADWCPHCQDQKAMFGDSGKILIDLGIYVECDSSGPNSQTDLCLSKGIEGYPTWVINNQQYPGVKSLDQLKQLGGC